MTTEITFIDENTSEFQLAHACPTCDGPLEMRVSTDGARSFCARCHVIGRPVLQRDAHQGMTLFHRHIGLA
jgi:hypothetical protein